MGIWQNWKHFVLMRQGYIYNSTRDIKLRTYQVQFVQYIQGFIVLYILAQDTMFMCEVSVKSQIDK